MINTVFALVFFLSLWLFASPLFLLVWEVASERRTQTFDDAQPPDYRSEDSPCAGGLSAVVTAPTLHRDPVNPSGKREA